MRESPYHSKQEEEKVMVVINPHAKKMEKMKNQLQALLHHKDL